MDGYFFVTPTLLSCIWTIWTWVWMIIWMGWFHMQWQYISSFLSSLLLLLLLFSHTANISLVHRFLWIANWWKSGLNSASVYKKVHPSQRNQIRYVNGSKYKRNETKFKEKSIESTFFELRFVIYDNFYLMILTISNPFCGFCKCSRIFFRS